MLCLHAILAVKERRMRVVEVAVARGRLDVELNRRIIEFHKSRNIEPHHGRRIFRDGENFFRWCFSDLATARAFIEQFGGAFYKTTGT